MLKPAIAVCLAASLFCCSLQADGRGYPSFRAGGLLFGDLYHVPSHHAEAGDGATGAVLTLTCAYALRRRKLRYGLVTMCIGGGQGTAMILESMH